VKEAATIRSCRAEAEMELCLQRILNSFYNNSGGWFGKSLYHMHENKDSNIILSDEEQQLAICRKPEHLLSSK